LINLLGFTVKPVIQVSLEEVGVPVTPYKYRVNVVWYAFPKASNGSGVPLVDLEGRIVKPVVFRTLEKVCHSIYVSEENGE
jgi:hypothetical protein